MGWNINKKKKTESLLISRKINRPLHPPLYMQNQQITEVESHKHLGHYFSNNFSWHDQINYSREGLVLGFNDTSTLVGHFLSSLREREKRYRRDSRGDEREGQGRKRKMNESEETRNKNIPPLPDRRPCPAVNKYQLDAPVTQDTRHLCLTQPPRREGLAKNKYYAKMKV